MQLIDLLHTRYSCRRYLPEPVDREHIIHCLEAARIAPSACNAQPWRFIVVDDPQLRTRVAAAAMSGPFGISKGPLSAPVLIVVAADRQGFLSRAGSLVRNTRFYLIDIGIACEHLVLQAAELGLGTCYIGWFNERAVIRTLGLKRGAELPLIIALGKPDPSHRPNDPIRRRAAGDTRKTLKEIASFPGDTTEHSNHRTLSETRPSA